MSHEIIECSEFETISVDVPSLIRNGRLLDSRIAERGYLKVNLSKGQLTLRSDRHVGLIPLTSRVSVNVRPRFPIENLAEMIALSGVGTNVIEGFGRSHAASFVGIKVPPLALATSLTAGAEEIAQTGLSKSYVTPLKEVPWRGRLSLSDTVRKHRMKGRKYAASFHQKQLSPAITQNIAIKAALEELISNASIKNNEIYLRAEKVIKHFAGVPTWNRSRTDLIVALSHELSHIPNHLQKYRRPLWAAFMLLQSNMPQLEQHGFVPLDSMIVDMADLFEAFLREELERGLNSHGLRVIDGNKVAGKLFGDRAEPKVTPDILIERDRQPVAVFDVKYKPKAKPEDRYQAIAYMEAYGVSNGGLILPKVGSRNTRLMGTTIGGKKAIEIRVDLSAPDMASSAKLLVDDVLAFISP